MNDKQLFVALPALRDEPFHIELVINIVNKAAIGGQRVTLWFPAQDQRYAGYAMVDFLAEVATDDVHFGGIMLPTALELSEPLSESMRRFPKPLVLIDTLPPELVDQDGLLPAGIAYVGASNEVGAKLAAKAMIDRLLSQRGSVRAGAEVLVLHANEQVDRHEAFVREIEAKLPEIHCRRIECDWSRTLAHTRVKELSRSLLRDRVVGVFGCNDEMTIGAMDAIREHLPSTVREIVFVGYDASSSARALMRNSGMLYASIAQPTLDIAGRAVSELRRLAAEKARNQGRLRRPSIVQGHEVVCQSPSNQRESVRILHVYDKLMIEAQAERASILRALRGHLSSSEIEDVPVTDAHQLASELLIQTFDVVHISTRDNLDARGLWLTAHNGSKELVSCAQLSTLFAREHRDRRLSHVVITGPDASVLGSRLALPVDLVYMQGPAKAARPSYFEIERNVRENYETAMNNWIELFYNALRFYRELNEHNFPGLVSASLDLSATLVPASQ